MSNANLCQNILRVFLQGIARGILDVLQNVVSKLFSLLRNSFRLYPWRHISLLLLIHTFSVLSLQLTEETTVTQQSAIDLSNANPLGVTKKYEGQRVTSWLLVLFLTSSVLLVTSPKKLLYTVANPVRGLLNREKKKKKKSGSAPPHPPTPRAARSEKRKKEKKEITRRIHMSRRYANRRHAGGLGPSRVRTRIPTTRRLGQWVSLRKILRFRVRLQLSQSRCLSLLLTMSGRVFLFFPPRGHEPPPTLRDRLNPNLSL